jgi:hypothetical protein
MAQQELTLTGSLSCSEERLGMAEVKIARRRGCESTAIHGRVLCFESKQTSMRKVLFVWLLITLWAVAEVLPHSPIRCVRDNKSQLTSMDTAVTRLRHPKKGWHVDLVGVVHVGPEAYYKKLNSQFKRYDAVLYELIAENDGGRPIPLPHSQGGTDNPLGMVQNGLGSLLGLDFQLNHIDYTPKNFVHADITPEQFRKSMKDKGESFSQILMRSLQQGGIDSPEAERELAEANLMKAVLQGPSPKDQIHMRRAMALLFAKPEQMTELLEGPGGGTLLTTRNQRAVSVLKQQVAQGSRNVAIFYGAAHMLDLEKRLRQDLGLEYVKQTWVPAWDLRLPQTSEGQKSK